MDYWNRGQIIGRGSSATVWLCTTGKSGHMFAVKSAELSQSDILQREQSIVSALDCPQVIAHKGYDITTENGKLLYNLFFEYAPGGSIIDAIRHHGGQLEEAVIRSYTRKILVGLEYLHSNGIVHCDIKCHNILVTADGPKIADFGCARRVRHGGDWANQTPIGGTPAYMALEVARGETQGFPADVWALGCTIIHMATGKTPWANVSDPVSALNRIGFSCEMAAIPSSKQAHDFLSKCLKRDPMERWSASELLNHAFVTEEEPAAKCYGTSASSNVGTPTSILDQKLWPTLTQKSCLVSPIERIRRLSGTGWKMPNWESDDTWVMVRSYTSGSEERETTSSYGEADIVCDSLEKILSVPSETIGCSGVDTFVDSATGTCKHQVILMPCICAKGAVCRSSHFEKEIVLFCSLQIALCKSFNLLPMSFTCLQSVCPPQMSIISGGTFISGMMQNNPLSSPTALGRAHPS